VPEVHAVKISDGHNGTLARRCGVLSWPVAD